MVHQCEDLDLAAAGALEHRSGRAAWPASSTSATSTSSARSSTLRRATRSSSFSRAIYHRWDSHYSESRNIIDSRARDDVISDHEFWGYKDYGANLLARLTPTRGFEYFAGYDFQNYSGEDKVLLIAPNTERVNALFGQIRTTRDMLSKATITRGSPVQPPERWRRAGRSGMSAVATTSPGRSLPAPASAPRSAILTPTSSSPSIPPAASAIRI